MAGESTDIKTISDAELNNLLNLAGPEEVATVVEETPTVFAKQTEAAANITIPTKKDDENNEPPPPVKSQEEIEEALRLAEADLESEESVTKKTTPVASDLETLQELVKSGDILLFEPEEGQKEKPLEEYSKKERVELLKANLQRIRDEEQAKAPAEFFEALPDKMKYAAKYIAEGGTNLEALFLSLAQSVQTENLDIATEAGQEQVVRRYGASIGQLTPEEIEEEIASLKDMPGALEKKANVYKPKLDAKQQQIVEQQVRDAEIRRKQGEENAAKYRENVYKALSASDLNGLHLTPTIQGMLFNGLTNFDKRAKNGYPTNELGLLLEKYNSIEPNPALIAKALWLLKDEKAYEDAVRATGNKETVKTTVRQLKTAESQKTSQSNLDTTKIDNGQRKTIKKPASNIFART